MHQSTASSILLGSRPGAATAASSTATSSCQQQPPQLPFHPQLPKSLPAQMFISHTNSDTVRLPRIYSSSSLLSLASTGSSASPSPDSSLSHSCVQRHPLTHQSSSHSKMSDTSTSTSPATAMSAMDLSQAYAEPKQLGKNHHRGLESISSTACVAEETAMNGSSSSEGSGSCSDGSLKAIVTDSENERDGACLNALIEAAITSKPIQTEKAMKSEHNNHLHRRTTAKSAPTSRQASPAAATTGRHDRRHSVSKEGKPKLPVSLASKTFNRSTYMSEADFISYFQRSNSLSEAVGAIAAAWPSYRNVSVYARARRLQLKYDSNGKLILSAKLAQFLALTKDGTSFSSAATLPSIITNLPSTTPSGDDTSTYRSQRVLQKSSTAMKFDETAGNSDESGDVSSAAEEADSQGSRGEGSLQEQRSDTSMNADSPTNEQDNNSL